MGRFGTWVIVVTVGLAGVTGCSSETPGQAVPTGVASDSSTAPPTTSTAKGDKSLDGVDPCGLLTEPVKARLGIIGAGETNSAPSSEQCKWVVRTETEVGSYGIGVIVFPELGLDDLVTDGEKTPVEVGERRAVQSLRGRGGACAVSIEVTTTSRVDVQVTANKDGAAAMCPTALEAARLIEPELP